MHLDKPVAVLLLLLRLIYALLNAAGGLGTALIPAPLPPTPPPLQLDASDPFPTGPVRAPVPLLAPAAPVPAG
ncbi:uncharacterized protein RSE6_15098 [Rhynchosporium secalis]|uniref:Secreted protein n=1 Tax=Rhynchosporium secalis TaxID=38038 RepID=A0A1E1MWS4_RHYSE|nr:uncharacterized protein RSE6_15098 [Rhynchosporium secalis]